MGNMYILIRNIVKEFFDLSRNHAEVAASVKKLD